jgi:tRNA uridine 5-carboxymethylaminomethyl modification enzyme
LTREFFWAVPVLNFGELSGLAKLLRISCMLAGRLKLYIVAVLLTPDFRLKTIMGIAVKQYDVLIVGGGHAGCEAALAAARMGCKALLAVINVDTIGAMSCNPAIGGLAKGHLVKEIDALGGEMAKNIDATGIQFRRLNTSKGPAVWSSRAQADRLAYRLRMKMVLENQAGLDISQTVVDELLVDAAGRISGVRTSLDEELAVKAVVIATGTFLNGLIHIGLKQFPAGRMGDPPSINLSQWFGKMGFAMGRMKTGTPPRLDGTTIDYADLEPQYGDRPPNFFSLSSQDLYPNGDNGRRQLPCHVTHTNNRTHNIIRGGIDRSPMYTGIIEGVGARYCPSIEDKVMRFADKDRHQIFLEPEGGDTVEVYPNGVSTSLPLDVQIAMLRSVKGLEKVQIIRPGYAIEYDYVEPLELLASLQTKRVPGLFLAGQINGTSGYEEAAAQGLMAGINAVRYVREQEPVILDRSQAYTGVLIDDLVTLGTREPYRLFTSRAEYRLLLREDNADLRLRQIGYDLGLVDKETYENFRVKKRAVEELRSRLATIFVKPSAEANNILARLHSAPIKQSQSLADLLRRPELSVDDLAVWIGEESFSELSVQREVQLQVKYQGYIERQNEQVSRFKRLEAVVLPDDLEYTTMAGLSNEVVEKLEKIRPRSLGQASRISGVTPAAISILQIHLKKAKLI